MVTILDTDCEGGTRIGHVAMIEIVALMVGRIEQQYSDLHYESPKPIKEGMMLQAGAPKALFQPGSSTVVLLFEAGRVRFAEDLMRNQTKTGVRTRYSAVLEFPLCETDVKVRSLLGHPAGGPGP